mmetsp:Transcript_31830/g.49778  ORF Transcript_31830/g.49778 Transcript_31830/m.49778 type:complete len:234 (+) Transcript_31830:566-1267(+)
MATCVAPILLQNSWLCETKTMVPSYPWRASSRASTVPTSKWLEGSSSIRMLCSTKTNEASATLAFSPPERVPTSCRALVPERPNAPRTDLIFSLVGAGPSAAARTLSRTASRAGVSSGSSWAKSWVKSPSLVPSPSTLLPSTRFSFPAKAQSRVLLPHPLGPMITSLIPLWTRKSRLSKRGSAPGHPTVAPLSLIISSRHFGGGGRNNLGFRPVFSESGASNTSILSSCFFLD